MIQKTNSKFFNYTCVVYIYINTHITTHLLSTYCTYCMIEHKVSFVKGSLVVCIHLLYPTELYTLSHEFHEVSKVSKVCKGIGSGKNHKSLAQN